MMENRDKTQPMMAFSFVGGGDAAAPIPFPALPVAGGVNSDHWNQVLPPVMPWSTSTSMPQVVRFTGDNMPFPMTDKRLRFGAVEAKPKVHLPKRKCPLEPDLLPAKIHITDEQMATRMKGLHISNELMPQDLDMHQEDDVRVAGCANNSSLPSLIVCDEIRQLQMPNNILPPELVARLERPSKALVLWKPPEERVAELQKITLQSGRKTSSPETVIQEDTSDDNATDSTLFHKQNSFCSSSSTPIFTSSPIRSVSFLSAINNNNYYLPMMTPITTPPTTTDVEEMSLDV